jgi:hypothetical protein
MMSAALFAGALLTRVLYLPFARVPAENYFWRLAGALERDGSLSIDGARTAAFEPLYPLFLAGSRWLTGDGLLLIRVIQCAVGAAGAVLLYRLALTLTGRRRVGVIAALLYAVCPLLIRYAVDLSDATLMTVLVLGFAGASVAAETPSRSAAAGAWLGFAILTRMMALPLVPFGAAILWRDRGWRAAAAFTATALLVVAPYAVRNYALSGGVLPARSGFNLFISNCEYTARILPDYGPDILEDYAISVFERRVTIAGPPSPVRERAEDAAYTRLALDHMAADPFGTLGLKLRNLWYFFSPTLVPARDPTAPIVFRAGEGGRFSIEHDAPRPLLDRFVYTVSYAPVLALALAGAWARRRCLRRDAILWASVVTFAAVHAIYFPTTRYRAPVEFVAFFYAAVALDRQAGRRQATPLLESTRPITETPETSSGRIVRCVPRIPGAAVRRRSAIASHDCRTT